MPDDPETPEVLDGDETPDEQQVPARIHAEVQETTLEGTRTFSTRQMRRMRDVLTRLYALRRARRLYPLEHPAIAEAAAQLFEVIAAYHAEGTDVPVTFFEDEVLLGDQVLSEESILFGQLIGDMVSIGAGSITFHRGLTVDELVRFSGVLGAKAEEVASGQVELAAIIERAGASHITLSTVNVLRDDATISEEDAETATRAAYSGAMDLLRELERLIRSNQAMSAMHVKGTVRSLIDNILHNRYAMLELSGLKNFDEYTFYHSVNVAILALALGSTLTRDYRFLSALGVGALLHDIGKMSVPLEILNKTGPLTSEEWDLVREHPVRGAEIMALTNGLDRASMVCVLEHHMRFDHAGYPERLRERQQHVSSRIVAVADAYDAMTSQRPYSAPRMQDEAMSIVVRNGGSALDPTLVRLFVGLLGFFPPRSVVLLSTGEVAVVVSPSLSDPALPRIRLIADASGALITPADIELEDNTQREGRSIVRCLNPSVLNVEVADYL